MGKAGIGIRGRVLGNRVVKVVMGGWYWMKSNFEDVINSMVPQLSSNVGPYPR